jgi:putative ABC transport system substrate-binding protein
MFIRLMKRREFIAGLGGAAAWPIALRAQQSNQMRRIGILLHGVQTDPLWQKRLAAFLEELEGLGWLENRNVHIEVQYSANNYDRLPALAREMVTLHPDVIFANTTPAIKALQGETSTIPLIFVEVSDPVGAGVVASLARPGGNISGILFYEDNILGKWLGMLKEIAPHLTRTALLGNPRVSRTAIFCALPRSSRRR